jgi:gamma-glutamyl hercynylcysteine S-oxide synthase
MFCPKCGTENRSNARFCKTCGYKLEGAVTVQSPVVESLDAREANGPWKAAGSSFLMDPALTGALAGDSGTGRIDSETSLIAPGAPIEPEHRNSEATTSDAPTSFLLETPPEDSAARQERFSLGETLPAWSSETGAVRLENGGESVSESPLIFQDEAMSSASASAPPSPSRVLPPPLADLSAVARTDEFMLILPDETAKKNAPEELARDVAPSLKPNGTSPLFAPPPAPPPMLPPSPTETRAFQRLEPEDLAVSEPPQQSEQNVKISINGERGTLPLQSETLPPDVTNAPFRPLTPPAGVPRPFGQRPPDFPPAPKSPGDLFSKPPVAAATDANKRSKRVFTALAAATVGGVVIFGAVGLIAYQRFSSAWTATVPSPSQPSVAESSAPPSVLPTEPPPPSPPRVPPDMVEIPGGEYPIGRDSGDFLDRYEKPRHMVTVATFYIDKTEVTNLDYKKFMDATGHSPPNSWQNGQMKEGAELFPVTGVTWNDANEYAKWAGKRLPTEEEWEVAARAQNATVFPWGDEADETRMNIGATGVKAAVKVGSYPAGASPFGILDMSGNVWEWTGSEAQPYPGSVEKSPQETLKTPLKPDEKLYVIRGGSYLDKKELCTATYRNWVVNVTRDATLGFRCAKSP